MRMLPGSQQRDLWKRLMTELTRRMTKHTFTPLHRALVTIAGVTLIAACGSEGGDSGNTGGTGGTSTGGNSGLGGTVNGSGGVASTSGGAGGGQASGGTSGDGNGGTNTGGMTGSAGSGGGGNPGGFAVFDDFEAGSGTTPNSTKWSILNTRIGTAESPGNTVEVTTEEAFSGSRSLKVDVLSGTAMLMTSVGLPANGATYFRARVRFANGSGSDLWNSHVTFVEGGGFEADGQPNSHIEVRLGGQAGMLHANLSQGDGLSPSPWAMPCALCTPPPPSNTWACLEGMFDIANEKVQAWLDGQEIVNAAMPSDWHVMSSTYPESLERIGFGWETYGGGANTVYYDDIAIGAERIHCD